MKTPDAICLGLLTLVVITCLAAAYNFKPTHAPIEAKPIDPPCESSRLQVVESSSAGWTALEIVRDTLTGREYLYAHNSNGVALVPMQ